MAKRCYLWKMREAPGGYPGSGQVVDPASGHTSRSTCDDSRASRGVRLTPERAAQCAERRAAMRQDALRYAAQLALLRSTAKQGAQYCIALLSNQHRYKPSLPDERATTSANSG